MDKDTEYKPTADILADAVQIIDTAQRSAYTTVNQVLVVRNWLLGKRIAEEELKGNGKERYGLQVIEELSKALSSRYGKGFDRSSLYRYVQFYKMFPEIVATLWQQSILLSWSHYRILLQVPSAPSGHLHFQGSQGVQCSPLPSLKGRGDRVAVGGLD